MIASRPLPGFHHPGQNHRWWLPAGGLWRPAGRSWRRSRPKALEVYQAGTLSGNPIAVTWPGLTTLAILEATHSLSSRAGATSRALEAGLGRSASFSGWCHAHVLPLVLTSLDRRDEIWNSWTRLATASSFGGHFVERGIYLAPSQSTSACSRRSRARRRGDRRDDRGGPNPCRRLRRLPPCARLESPLWARALRDAPECGAWVLVTSARAFRARPRDCLRGVSRPLRGAAAVRSGRPKPNGFCSGITSMHMGGGGSPRPRSRRGDGRVDLAVRGARRYRRGRRRRGVDRRRSIARRYTGTGRRGTGNRAPFG